VDGVVADVYATTGGADGGAATGAYNLDTGSGNISLTGLAPSNIDMNGVLTIEFWDTTGLGSVIGTPLSEGAGFIVSGDRKSITIPKANVHPLWAPAVVTANRAFRLTTAAGVTVISTVITAVNPP
jgi:hypothetical protein